MAYVPEVMPTASPVLRDGSVLLFCVALLVVYSSPPFQRWLRRWVTDPVQRGRHRVKNAIKVRYDEIVNRLMDRMISQVAPVISEVLPDGDLRSRPLIGEAVLRWWKAVLWVIPARAIALAFIVYCTANIDSIVDVIANPRKYDTGSPHGGAAPRHGRGDRPNPIVAPIGDIKTALAWVADKLAESISKAKHLWRLELEPRGIVTQLTYIMVILVLIPVLKALYRFVVALASGAMGTLPEGASRPHSPRRPGKRAAVDDEERYRPVVVLLLTAADCARTWRSWGQGSALDTPRVSVRRAEYVIQNAWRTRCEYDSWSARMRQRHALRAHAAKVIGALREVERRQYTDPDIGIVIQELTDMLLVIAERYADGRIGQLLDDVENIDAATDYEWLRLLGVGVFSIGSLIAASMANLPEEADGLLVGLTLLLTGSWFFRHKLAHPMDLIDVLRGSDRK